MILNVQVDLVFGLYATEDWTVVLEMDSSSTLEDLHYAIQGAVGFENDHMYEFYISRTAMSRDKHRFDDENEEIFFTVLSDVFPLQKDRRLYYMFDYGDSWLFRVKVNRNKPFEPVEGIEYPRLVKEVGEKPEQYPGCEDDCY